MFLQIVAERQVPGPDPAEAAVATYRYLRLAMVGMVVGLAAAVGYEVVRTGETGTLCWQTSLSAYYYTPVQNFFVGALVTIGVCLVVLKGNTDWEDLLLNFAGLCAPVVAFVPTPDRGSCGVVTDTANRNLNIGNNVFALLVVGGAALVTFAGLVERGRRKGSGPGLPRIALLGYALTVLVFLATVAVFWLRRTWFTAHGHDIAAVAMFAFILANVVLNAVNLYYTRRGTPKPVRRLNRYTWIAVLMLVALAIHVVLWVAHFRFVVLTIEGSLIVLFAVFWGIQTGELWDQGLRPTKGDGGDGGGDGEPSDAVLATAG